MLRSSTSYPEVRPRPSRGAPSSRGPRLSLHVTCPRVMKFFCGCNNESFFHFVSQVAKKKSRPARGRQRHVLRKTSQESSITRTTPHGKKNGAGGTPRTHYVRRTRTCHPGRQAPREGNLRTDSRGSIVNGASNNLLVAVEKPWHTTLLHKRTRLLNATQLCS